MYVSFKSDVKNVGAGFSLNYTAVDPPTCNKTNQVSGTFGIISSPMFPLPYVRDLDCTWFITTPEDTRIAIRLNLRFNIWFNSDGCENGDYLQIFDGPSTTSTQYQQAFCGNFPPKGFLSTTNKVTVQFVTQSSYSGSDRFTGFSLNWTAEAICQSEEFRCWDGTCINGSKKCNKIIDCPADNADEAVCKQDGSGTCGTPEIPPVFEWDSRIVGGENAVPGSWPWQGRLEYFVRGDWTRVCGAVLISEGWALTAAHCIFKESESRALFGVYNGTGFEPQTQNVSIKNFVVPQNWKWEDAQAFSGGYDIALIEFSSPVTYTAWVEPVCLPTLNPNPGTWTVITGWGSTDYYGGPRKESLQQARIPLVSQESCKKRLLDSELFEIDNVLCAGFATGGVSVCSGDSGGPIVFLNGDKWELIGISSFSTACGLVPDRPAGFTNVSAYLTFINYYRENSLSEMPMTSFVINGENGTVSSPNHGDRYPLNTHIRWYIESSPNTRITVKFDDIFTIENVVNHDKAPCSFDYLLMWDGSNTGAMKYNHKKLCGIKAPPNFETKTNHLVVEFWSDSSFSSKGFSFNWTTSADCNPNEYRCRDKSCIPMNRTCDGNYDCPGHEDEFECASPMNTECGKPEVSPIYSWSPVIIGGHNTIKGSHPWQVALFVEDSPGVYEFVCGGSLISEYWVITAAHCLDISSKYQIAIGGHNLAEFNPDERRINASFVIPHPDYGEVHDIGFVRLEEKVDTTSKWHKPICLPSSNDTNIPAIGSVCVVTGWGLTNGIRGQPTPDTMQQTLVTILNDSYCITDFYLGVSADQPLDTYICAGHESGRVDTCSGDSGGPLSCLVDGAWVLYGITSWGFSCTATNTRGFYERVSEYLDLIDQVFNMEVCSEYEIREGTKGTVTIPQLFGKYFSNSQCSWLLRAPANKLIVIRFKLFDIEDCSPFGNYDYLDIYDGNSSEARQISDKSFCGEDIVVKGFESSSNEVFISFVSDDSVDLKGFIIEWEAVDDCNEDEFRCWDGSCIEENLHCDQVYHCSDKSDEIVCAIPNAGCGQQKILPDFLWPARIVGGMVAVDGSWPWQALILDDDGDVVCGASIVNEIWILTAAECFLNVYIYEVVVAVGQYDIDDIDTLKQYTIAEIYYYDEIFTEDYDIALLKLDAKLTFEDKVQPACLSMADDLVPGEICVVTGWGWTAEVYRLFSAKLRQNRVPIISPDTCQKVEHFIPFDGERMFCAGDFQGGVDACRHDTGGPLVCYRNSTWRQYGIVSSQYGCGNPMAPTYYTKISFYKDWIERTIGEPLSTPWQVTTSMKMPIDTTATTQEREAENETTEASTTPSSTTASESQTSIDSLMIESTASTTITTTSQSSTTSGYKIISFSLGTIMVTFLCQLLLFGLFN
uniref:uncharacterized protein LOC120348165 isoform X1 n=1 Tax=Styela clava TaxID=7725 RepID=UPI00193A6F9B|nr:uncharacterized protein LOC120348165 isoform X1 [Styela clava]